MLSIASWCVLVDFLVLHRLLWHLIDLSSVLHDNGWRLVRCSLGIISDWVKKGALVLVYALFLNCNGAFSVLCLAIDDLLQRCLVDLLHWLVHDKRFDAVLSLLYVQYLLRCDSLSVHWHVVTDVVQVVDFRTSVWIDAGGEGRETSRLSFLTHTCCHCAEVFGLSVVVFLYGGSWSTRHTLIMFDFPILTPKYQIVCPGNVRKPSLVIDSTDGIVIDFP